MQLFNLLISLLLAIFISGCESTSTPSEETKTTNTQTLHEHELAQNPNLVASLDHVIVIHLEHPDENNTHEHDSHATGVDHIPLHFPDNTTHVFTYEHEEGKLLSAKLHHEEGHELLSIHEDNQTHTQEISAGTHILELTHEGDRNASEYIVFIRPENNTSVSSLNRSLIKPRRAGFSGTTISAYSCPNCDLSGQSLINYTSHGDLSGANFTGSNLSGANLARANLSGANFTNADLSNADITDANITGAIFTGSNQTGLITFSCGGEAQLACVSRAATFVGMKGSCAEGTHESEHGDSCFSCPTGYNFYERDTYGNGGQWDPRCEGITGGDIAATWTGEHVNHCKEGTFYDSGKCWTCPTGYNRTIFHIEEPNACEKPAYEEVKKATYVKSSACPSGSFYDSIRGGECWSCPSGYNRTWDHIDSSTACSNGWFSTKPATRVRTNAELSCAEGDFFDGKDGGGCWSCGTGWNRTLAPVDASNACSRVIPSIFDEASVEKTLECEENAFTNEFTNSSYKCFTCPGNYNANALKNPESVNGCIPEQECAPNLLSYTVRPSGAGGNLLAYSFKRCTQWNNCGDENERPCYMNERIPSCNEGLRENFQTNTCEEDNGSISVGFSGLVSLLGEVTTLKNECQNAVFNSAPQPESLKGIDKCMAKVGAGFACSAAGLLELVSLPANIDSALSHSADTAQCIANTQVVDANPTAKTSNTGTGDCDVVNGEFWHQKDGGSCWSCPSTFTEAGNFNQYEPSPTNSHSVNLTPKCVASTAYSGVETAACSLLHTINGINTDGDAEQCLNEVVTAFDLAGDPDGDVVWDTACSMAGEFVGGAMLTAGISSLSGAAGTVATATVKTGTFASLRNFANNMMKSLATKLRSQSSYLISAYDKWKKLSKVYKYLVVQGVVKPTKLGIKTSKSNEIVASSVTHDFNETAWSTEFDSVLPSCTVSQRNMVIAAFGKAATDAGIDFNQSQPNP